MGKKTGFLMATVHQGSATAMWKALAEETSNHPEDALFVFPGGGYLSLNLANISETIFTALQTLKIWTDRLFGHRLLQER